MDESQLTEPGAERPSCEAVKRAGEDLLVVLRQEMPRQWPSGTPEWKGYLAAMVVRLGDLLHSVVVLMDANQAIDGAALLRILFEHAVKFWWLAAAPEERYLIWRTDGLIWDRKLHDEAKHYGFEVLSKEKRAVAQGLTGEIPRMPQMVREVDDYWVGRVESFQPNIEGTSGLLSMQGLYLPMYRTLSEAVHGRAEVVEAYIGEGNPMWPVGPSASENSIWWPMAVSTYVGVLLVSHEVLGAPGCELVMAINNHMYD